MIGVNNLENATFYKNPYNENYILTLIGTDGYGIEVKDCPLGNLLGDFFNNLIPQIEVADSFKTWADEYQNSAM